MSLPAGYKPRRGDILILHGEVKFDADDDQEGIHVKVDYHSMRVARDLIVGVAAYHFDPGEIVRLKDTDVDHEVIAIDDGHAWVKNNGGRATYSCRELVLSPNQKKDEDE